MSELSSIDIIKKYASSRSYPILVQEKMVAHAAMSTKVNDKVVILDLNSIEKNLFLVFYDSYGTKPGMNSTYCGIFKKIKEKINSEARIYQRDALDFLRIKKRFKTGDKYFDKVLSIYTTEATLIKKVVNRSFVKYFTTLNKNLPLLEFNMDNEYLSYSKELSNSNVASLRSRRWLLEDDQLDMLIETGSKLLGDIK